MPQVSRARRERLSRAFAADKVDVAKWTEQLGSKSTQYVWPRRLAAFCVDVGKTPGDLIHLASEVNAFGLRTELRDLLAAYDKTQRARGRKGSTVAFSVKVVKSWLAYNGVDVPRGLFRVREADSVYSEAALTKEELRRVLHAASPRERAAVSLMAFAGFRPMVLGNYDGTDGLRLRDLPDLEVNTKDCLVSFKKVPARIVVRRELSKARHTYFSFLTAEGCEFVAEYLTSRIRPGADWKRGEKLNPDSPLIIPERAGRDFIVTTNIGDLVRNAIRKAGLSARPYSLRTTFATRLLSSEAEANVPHAFAQFWMGHSGDMTARYAQNRGQLPPELPEQMRDAFRRCEPFLSTERRSDVRRELVESLVRAVEESTGSKSGDGTMTTEDLIAALKRTLETGAGGRSASPAPEPIVDGPIPSPKPYQRAAPPAQLDGLLEQGWVFRAIVGAGTPAERVIVERFD